MDAYAEVIARQRLIEASWSRVMATKKPVDALLDNFDESRYWLNVAQLEMFGSPAIQLINNMVAQSSLEWFGLYQEWKLLVETAETDPSAAEEADARWPKLKSAHETAELAGKRLVEAMVAEADFQSAVRMPRRSERALKRHLSRR